MAELLTNNPNAMKSLSGMTPEIPCSGLGNGPLGTGMMYITGSRTNLPFGFIGRMLNCSFNNFNDWLNTLKSRFAILSKNYSQIVNNSKQAGKMVLSDDEIQLGNDIESIKEDINAFKKVERNLPKNMYYKYIAEIQGLLAETNSLLEYAQERQEYRRGEGKYVSTNIPVYSNPIKSTASTVVTVAGLGVVGWLGYKLIKGSLLGG